MPFKVFTNGSILPDTDLNDYLMEQTIISCTSATRPGSPNNGMTVFETDTNRYSSYSTTAAAWLTLGQTISGTYTPTLTAATTNPTLGSGSAVGGHYTLFGGKWCTIRGTITFGTSGVNAGSGQYFFSLPFTADSSITGGVPFCGAGVIRDTSAGSLGQITTYAASGASTFSMLYSNAVVTSAIPWTWAASDYLSWTMTYEIA